MGATYVDVTIRNPADPGRSWIGKFLVVTGAFDSLVHGGASKKSDCNPGATVTTYWRTASLSLSK